VILEKLAALDSGAGRIKVAREKRSRDKDRDPVKTRIQE
jgi:hypothetical protein